MSIMGPSSPGRGMMPGGGVDLAIADQGYDTFKLLEQLNIPYDEPPGCHRCHGDPPGNRAKCGTPWRK